MEMPMSIQIYNTFKNRWCGAHWQRYGLSVIPTVSWSSKASYEFCFDGIEVGSVVALSTLGVLNDEKIFMEGYNEMVNRIKPSSVVCYGKIFSDMSKKTNIVSVDYLETTGRRK
jgi:hypothetical protein